MKTAIYSTLTAIILAAAPAAMAAEKVAMPEEMGVSSFDLKRVDNRLAVDMTLDANKIKKMRTNREVVYTPILVKGNDTVRMKSFTIAGKNRWYAHDRADGNPALKSIYRAGHIEQPIVYSYDVPYADWMEDAMFEVECQECGCCGKPGEKVYRPIAQVDLVPKAFEPQVVYITPKAEAVKERSIAAKAYVDFPVNKIEIYPDYRRNPVELKKILATIDSVRTDKNLTFQSIHIKGFASPEGTYANNERLAKGRTQTLADYVRNQFHFQKNIITTSYTPEDWAGLEEYVRSEAAQRTLTNPAGILAIITDPAYRGKDDLREAAIKTKFPKDYQYLLAEVYPGLRHSDYEVKFIVRSYTQPEEIIETMHTAPQNLSLDELFVAAQSVKPGSDIYNEAFDIAAKMYPNDPIANLNAGNAALMRGDLTSAYRYLGKAGDSDEAKYARGVLAALEGDYGQASDIFSALKGMRQAREAEQQIKAITANKDKHFRQIATSF